MHDNEYFRNVIISNNNVFVLGQPGCEDTPPSLVTAKSEILMELCELTRARRFNLDLSGTIETDISSSNTDVEGPSWVDVNALDDWFVRGQQTLQVSMVKTDPYYRMTFRRQIAVTRGDAPLTFFAKLAIHRARADLIVHFTDTDTGETQTQTVEFDQKYLGGKRSEDYQNVEVALPDDLTNGHVELSVDYHGATETSQFPPFLFIADAHVREEVEDADLAVLALSLEDEDNVDSTAAGPWFRAAADVNLHDLKPAFLRFGEAIKVIYSAPVEKARPFFDEGYYEANNPEIDFTHVDPFTHYLCEGTKQNLKPNYEFSAREYRLRHPEIESQGAEPLLHYANVGQQSKLSLGVFEEKLGEIWDDSNKHLPAGDEAAILSRAQDMMVPMSIIETRKLAVFVVPEHNSMSGGIYSMFSIADHLRRTRTQHGYDVLVMTRPNPEGRTYVRNSSFKNSETVLRFDQIRLFSEVSELQLHLPEYTTVDFVHHLSHRTLQYLLNRDHVHINILNQNTRLMPEPSVFRDLRRISDTIAQSVSHHAFFGQDFADHYNLPSLLLPAYTDLSPYPPIPAAQKENLIIYSDDDAPYRRAVLDRLSELDDYKLVKIKDMTFDTYMDLATRCRFSVSFGEGFDGYVAQPMYQGGIGLALYTDEFFPDESYAALENFFETEEEMIEQIVPTIRRLEADRARYEALNAVMREKWEELYSYDDYVARIGKLIRKEYEVCPTKSH